MRKTSKCKTYHRLNLIVLFEEQFIDLLYRLYLSVNCIIAGITERRSCETRDAVRSLVNYTAHTKAGQN